MNKEIPKTLYYIAEKEELDSIRKDGVKDNIVQLVDRNNLAPWLAVGQYRNPVIMEVDTENVIGMNKNQETFKDRDFIGPEGYSRYCATEIPASAIKEVKLGRGSNEFGIKLRGDMIDQFERTAYGDELEDAVTGLNHLKNMGLVQEYQIDAMVESHMSSLLNKEDDFTRAINDMNPHESYDIEQ